MQTENEVIITWRVEDRVGHHRILGTTEEKARAVAMALSDDMIAAPLKLQRVSVTIHRVVTDVETFGHELELVGAP